MTLAPPILSLYDVGATGEGSIDPLSLAPLYERLANRILPHITVRMKRPRYLTAIAAGAHICAEFGEVVAADERTPAWLVFEWHVVEALVRNTPDEPSDGPSGIPGISKVRQVLKFGKRLGADTYLKTATVFGYTGIYARLARSLLVVDDAMRPDEAGYGLLRAWEEDQGLEGFVSGSQGEGAALRHACREAVVEGLKQGHTHRNANWSWWKPLHLHFNPDAPGKRERAAILRGLLSPVGDPETAATAREYIEAIVARGQAVSRESEPAFMRMLMTNGSTELRRRLRMIDAYERAAKLLTDGFELICHLSTIAGGRPVGEKEFAAHVLGPRLVNEMPAALDDLELRFSGDKMSGDVVPLLQRYRSITTASQLFAEMVDHHEAVQRDKPPDGKRPWLERANGVSVRPQYQVTREPQHTDDHVHDYRTASASSFLRDLGKLPR